MICPKSRSIRKGWNRCWSISFITQSNSPARGERSFFQQIRSTAPSDLACVIQGLESPKMKFPEFSRGFIESINPAREAGPDWAYLSRNILLRRTRERSGQRAGKGKAVRFISRSHNSGLYSPRIFSPAIVHQKFLHIHCLITIVWLEAKISPIFLHDSGTHIVFKIGLQHLITQVLNVVRAFNREHYFHPVIEVPPHQVGAAHIYFLVSVIAKIIDTAVFKIT